MCDNKNELQKSERDKSKRNTSTRLDLDITNTTDTYPEFDFLDLLRNLQVENKKAKRKIANEEGNQSNSYSDDSDVELLARFYNEKYGNCSEFDADGYDEDDPFIDNSDAVIESIPNGLQTEFGGFYINRGKLTLVREENSSSSVSEDVDKFLTQKRLIKRTGLDEDSDEKQKECNKIFGGNTQSGNHISNKSNNNAINNINNDNIPVNSTTNNVNSCVNSVNTNNSNNNNGIFGNCTVKSRKKSGEFHHKSKKNRKTATPKIPDHLLHRKPFSGSSEFRKNINEIKKNRMKTLEAEKKTVSSDLISSDSPSTNTNIATDTTTSIAITTGAMTTSSTITAASKNINCNYNGSTNINKNNNNDSDQINTNNSNVNNDYHHHNHYLNTKKEAFMKKKTATVKEIVKDRDAASEVIEAVATGADLYGKNTEGESSSDSETSESSHSDSTSESSDEKFTEKRKISSRPSEEVIDSQRNTSPNGVIKDDITAKNFAHLNDSLKSLIDKIVEISKEEKSKLSSSRLNSLLLRIDSRLRELPVSERSAVLDHLATILQLKRESITKKTKKLLFIQEETKMTVPLKKLKESVADMMPALESNYLKEFTKATGTSTVDPGPLPLRKFPWNEDLRCHLRDIIQHRENCYHIVRPRKESLTDYVRNFLETKLISFWPKDWMTVDILWEEGKSTSSSGSPEDKHKSLNKFYPNPNSSSQKKSFGNFQNVAAGNKKPVLPIVPSTETAKPSPNVNKSAEVKSILIPRKVPQNAGNTSTKSNYPASTGSVLQSNTNVGRYQGSGNKVTTQDYLEKLPQNRNSSQQVPNNKTQQHIQSNQTRVIKSVSSGAVQNTVRPNVTRTTSPNSSNKSVLNRNCSNSQQNVYKTIEIHSKPVASTKSVGNAVTISPVTESMLKDFSSSPEILNLTKNPSVCISKITDCSDSKFNRSSSPSINKPLPSGITISPTNALSSNFLTKPKKPLERASENRINVSITKQISNKDKKKSVLNLNIKREGPLQNIPDCISVTSNIVSHERPNKVEHVRKRAIQEYHEQQQQQLQQQQQQQVNSPERLKLDEKKMKLEENFLPDMDIREEKLDDKNFSKIFDSVIAKTSESVIRADDTDCQITGERFAGLDGEPFTNSNNLPVFSGLSHYKNKAPKLREVRVGKEKSYMLVKGDGSTLQGSDEMRQDECEEYSEKVKELQVQKEMDRVMQNLVELSNQRVNDSEYEIDSHYSPTAPPARPQSSFHVYPKMLYK